MAILFTAFILPALIVGGVVTVIIGSSIWLRKLVKGDIGIEEFESGRFEWGDTEVVTFRRRIGDRFVAAGEKILGEEKIEPGIIISPITEED